MSDISLRGAAPQAVGGRTRKATALETVALLALLYVVTWTIAPPLSVGGIYRVLALLCACTWIVVALFLHPLFLLESSPLVPVSLLYLVFTLSEVVILGGNTLGAAIVRNAWFLIVVFFGLAGEYYSRYDRNGLNRVLDAAAILCLVFSITTIAGSIQHPGITRNAGGGLRSEAEVVFAASHGIGTYGFTYMVLVFSCLLFSIAFSGRVSGLRRGLYLLSAIAQAAAVLTSGFTIAILFLCAAVLLLLVFSRGINGRSMVAAAIITMALIVLGNEIIGLFTRVLVSLSSGSSLYAGKIRAILAFNEYQTISGPVEWRFDAYAMTLRAIGTHPLLGSYVFTGAAHSGGHSSLLDAFADYGVIGGALFFSIVILSPLRIAGPRRRMTTQDLVFLFLMLGIGVINVFIQAHGVVMFLLFPAVRNLATIAARAPLPSGAPSLGRA